MAKVELKQPIVDEIKAKICLLYTSYTDWYDSLADEDVLLLTLDSLYE